MTEGIDKNILTKEEYRFINIMAPSDPFFVFLPKVHKDTTKPPGRPILSGINGITSNLSQLLDMYLRYITS